MIKLYNYPPDEYRGSSKNIFMKNKTKLEHHSIF